MKFRYSLFIVAVMMAMTSQAQFGYYEDALRFSQTNAFGSTARVQGFGGAQVALGGDVSVAGANPAGLGFFNKSVFSITPGAFFHNNDGIYNGNLVTSYKPNINLPNMGLVLNHTVGDIPDEKFKGGSFAISVTRINDFNKEFAYEGYSSRTSVVDNYLEGANSTVVPGTEPNLDVLTESEFGAYTAYLLDIENDRYGAPSVGYEPFQSERVTTSGGQNQLNFSWGGNYNDQVYFGAGLGIQTLSYRIERYYTESDFFYEDNSNLLNSLSVQDELDINGTGINGTFGMIVRPIPFVTVGISYVTPTYFSLKDETGFVMRANWNNFQYDENTLLTSEEYESPLIRSDYNLKTPGRLNLGTAIFIGKNGFLTGDVEFVDHGAALLQSNTVEFDMNDDNALIRSEYKSVINYRVGGEFRLDDFRFRGGYGYMGDPYVYGNQDRSRQNITFGAGLRQKDFFIDLAVVKTFYDEYYEPYEVIDKDFQPQVKIRNDNTSVSATIGFNF